MKTFDRNPYLKQSTIISMVQRWIIIHSIIYYELNSSLVSDQQFDRICRHLVDLKEESPQDYKNSQYYYCMNDFDGTTGFYLYSRLRGRDRDYLLHLAQSVIRLAKGDRKCI